LQKKKGGAQGIVQLESSDRIIVFPSNRKYNAGGMHYIEGSTDQKKEPVVHELWASDIALEGLVAILSG
jgi:hypothetical protein